MSKISHEQLLSLLSYDEVTGDFRWKVKSNRNSDIGGAGRLAGCINNQGYRVITIKQRQYQSARLAWFYVNRQWPDQVDHKNCNRCDDRISNLRDASHRQNNYNRRVSPKNKSGYKGVRKKWNKWEANIWLNKRSVYLGVFDSPEEAAAAYGSAAKQHFGEFARLA